ncbi:MAG: FAD-dependent oxidoreductase [Candidatus Yanofskybacteria bacterium]|nr:FAD-dependent oxidoreductase [Candidatus Yanofskybacteria bacterium]
MIKILILGGGFGGIRTALDLSKKFAGRKDVQITLVDKNDSQTFSPALYEIASIYGIDHEHPFHSKIRGAVCIPYRDILGSKNMELVQAEISHIDLEQKHVVTSAGNTLEFDYLIIALGAVASTFGIPGAEEYAYKFKTVEDGIMLNDKMEDLYIETGRGERKAPINILIAGAGFNGIELAAELSNCTVHVAHRHGITHRQCATITLIEAGPAILPMVSEANRRTIEKRLKELGINVLVNSPVEEVGSDFVKIKNSGTLSGDLIVWSAGVKSLDLFSRVEGLELDERGRIFVDDFLRVKNRKNVFAIGDNTIFLDAQNNKPVPQMAFVAIKQGGTAAKNIYELITAGGDDKNADLRRYVPGYNFWIAPVGGKNAVAHLGKWGTYSGFLGYVLREAADMRYFLSILPLWKGLKLFYEDIKVFSRND